jgi:hypothetical protein
MTDVLLRRAQHHRRTEGREFEDMGSSQPPTRQGKRLASEELQTVDSLISYFQPPEL